MRKTHEPGPLWLWFAGILALTAPLGWALSQSFSEPLNRRLREQVRALLRESLLPGTRNPALNNSSSPTGAQSIHSCSSSETG